MRKKYVVAIALLVLVARAACAQDSEYVYKPRIKLATESAITSPNCNRALQLDQLAGEKIVFVVKSKTRQRFGYQQAKTRAESMFYDADYQALVGRVGTVQPANDVVVLEKTDERVFVNTSSGHIPDVTLISDIEFGRTRWVGKTLWLKGQSVRPSPDANPNEWKKVKQYQPVTVVDVVVGADKGGAIDFVVKFNDGLEGLVGLTLSVSNNSVAILKFLRADDGRKDCDFDITFYTEDPRLKFKWPPKIWAAIENGQVVVGMTENQVVMSWGKPKKVNRTRTGSSALEQWVYGGSSYVYFDGRGRVTAVQD